MPARTQARATAALLLACALLLAACAAPGAKPATGTSAPPEATGAPAADATPTVKSLAGASLSDRQEGLVFDYLVAGGLKALESRFGKPAASYTTAVDEASTAFAELADGRTYQVQSGLDASGRAIVMSHGVEGKQGQSLTAQDKAFLDAMKDGVTTLEQANAYLKRVPGAKARAGVMDPKGLNVPAHVWALPSGEGFLVIDLSSLNATQLEAIGSEPSVPFQVLYWDATRWRAL